MNRISDFTSKYFTVSRISGLSDMGRPIPFLSTNAYDYNLSDYSSFIDCYYGMGVGYRGNVNITHSGRPCQLGPLNVLIVIGDFLKMLSMVRMTLTCVVTRMLVPRMDLGATLLTLKFDGNTATYPDVLQEVFM